MKYSWFDWFCFAFMLVMICIIIYLFARFCKTVLMLFIQHKYVDALLAINEYNEELSVVYPHDQRRFYNRISPNDAMYSLEYTKRHFYKGVRAIVKSEYVHALTPYAKWIK